MDEFDKIKEQLGDLDPGDFDPRDAFNDPDARAVRIGNAERVQFLGKDPATGTERWHRRGMTELRYADGSVDLIED